MQSSSAQAQLRIRESLDAHPELTIILDASGSPSSRLRARFLAHDEDSIQVQLNTALGQNMLISIAGQVDTGAGRAPLLGQYRVRSCRVSGIGKYRADLIAEKVAEERPQETTPDEDVDLDLDYYEVLQVSRQADADTIRRVYHALAQRYHPDNRATASGLRFRQVVAANAVLSDPEKRAAYDVRLVAQENTRFRIFESAESAEGVQAEIRKRAAILRLLYTKRLTDARDATLRGRELVEMLGVPMEHLEFALWQLKEKRLIYRTDNNNRYEITYQGVEAFEDEQASFSKKHLVALPAPA